MGIAKQAVMFEIIPMLHSLFNTVGLDNRFAPVFSICTWVIYSLAMPTMTIAALHFGDLYLENPKRMRMIKCVMYVPAMIILFFFSPLQFTEYQLNSRPFWITYAIYNFGFAFALTFFVLRNIYLDNSVSSKKQKKMVAIVLLPPLYYWLITIFVVRLFQLKHLFELWQANLFLVLICISIFIFLAFQDGFMGLKLVKQNYDWNTNIKLLNLSTAYARHFIKNQTPKMEMCIDNLKEYFSASDSSKGMPKEIEILSGSVSTLKEYFDRIFYQSQDIVLREESCRIKDLFIDAITAALVHENSDMAVDINIRENVFLECDKRHMTEVFNNIITNAIESIKAGGKTGKIEITEAHDRTKYYLKIKDNGIGIDDDMLDKIFAPYESTKNKDSNFGLGLTYCKNVIEQHGGRIYAESLREEETTFIIALPIKRMAVSDICACAAAQTSVAQLHSNIHGK